MQLSPEQLRRHHVVGYAVRDPGVPRCASGDGVWIAGEFTGAVVGWLKEGPIVLILRSKSSIPVLLTSLRAMLAPVMLLLAW